MLLKQSLIFSYYPPGMSKLLKSQAGPYRRLKTNREEHLTKHIVSIHAYVKKQQSTVGKVMMRKVTTNRKKQDS